MLMTRYKAASAGKRNDFKKTKVQSKFTEVKIADGVILILLCLIKLQLYLTNLSVL